MTLVEFLLARIAEDESKVVGISGGDDPDFFWGPDRIRVECEAKGRIVDLHVQVDPTGVLYPSADPMCQTCHRDGDEPDWPCATLQAIALPYADHPDYDKTWRP